MHKHMIILSSSYTEGTRIALDAVDDPDLFDTMVADVRRAYGGKIVPFSTHCILSDGESWDSVGIKDPYFQGVRLIGSSEEFVRMLQSDRYLKGTDVARYILSRRRCTHTRLEKMTYMAYAEYLCSSGSKLFTDDIFAFAHGPVVDSVLKRYSGDSRQHPAMNLDDSSELEYGGSEMSIRSRIIFAEDGLEKLAAIDRAISRFEGTSTEDLVGLTHTEGSPWHRAYRDGERYIRIPDDLISRYHSVEAGTRRTGQTP